MPKSLVAKDKGDQMVMQEKMRKTGSSRANACFTPQLSVINILCD